MKIFESLEAVHIGSLSLSAVCSAAVILIICIIVRTLLMKVIERAVAKSRINDGIKSFLVSAVGIILWMIIILIVADSLGIPITSLLAVISVAGLALSLSVQNILSNVFSGITILVTRPFAVGDYVDIGGTVGNVRMIRLFYTTLETLDGRVVHIPNSTVVGEKIEDYSTKPIRRIDLEISASYDDATENVRAALKDAVDMTPGIVFDPAPFISISSYGESAINYVVRAWAENPNFLDTKFALTQNIRECFENRGVSMTYNHLNIHVVEK